MVMRTALQKARQAPSSTKARILATAEEVFATKGFSGASTREIAAKAQVNISSLHYHWESKETLYFAVFQNIYDRILAVIGESIPKEPARGKTRRPVVEQAMGGLFDFLAQHPNIPKLLMRRLVENDESHVDIERDVLVPAWSVFAGWIRTYRGRKLKNDDSQLFMLTLFGVVLMFLMDSRQFKNLLGGSIHDPKVQRRVRAHVIRLVLTLLGEAPR